MIQKQAKRHIIKEQRQQIDWLLAKMGDVEKMFLGLLDILEEEGVRPEWKAKRAALTIRDYLGDKQG